MNGLLTVSESLLSWVFRFIFSYNESSANIVILDYVSSDW